jgi:putative ATPase
MKKLGYGTNYLYAHDYPGNFVRQQFMPDKLRTLRLWNPGDNPTEATSAQRQQQRWGDYKDQK